MSGAFFVAQSLSRWNSVSGVAHEIAALLLGQRCSALDVRAPVRVHDLAVPALVPRERVAEGSRRALPFADGCCRACHQSKCA